MKKIVVLFSVLFTMGAFSACADNVSSVEKSVTTAQTTTTPAQVTTTTAATMENIVDVVTTVNSSADEDVTTTTTQNETTEDEEISTTTAPVVTTTTNSKVVTSITTPKVTTTSKTVSSKTTTTKKPTVTTTTTKKATTTTTTAKKQEITTTTSPVIKITQSDVDKLVNELQEYSTNKHFEINKERVLSEIEEYKDVLPTGYDWEDYKNEVISAIPTFTPSNSSWGTPRTISVNCELIDFFARQKTYDELLAIFKEDIDYMYSILPNCHFVIYDNWCPNGDAINADGVPAWEIYLLY